ncbi:MAG: hypothetical protein ACRDUV_07805 [Pseudonocardiaceae bacterium]
MLAWLGARPPRSPPSPKATPDEPWRPQHRATRGPQRCNPPHDEEGAGNRVDISPERDALPRNPATGPWSGSETWWRNTPQCTVHLTMDLMVLGAVLLVCLGLLLGAAWTVEAMQPKLRRQAEERRRLNAEWAAIRTARQRRGVCPRCASPLSERDWSVAPMAVEDPPDDDD